MNSRSRFTCIASRRSTATEYLFRLRLQNHADVSPIKGGPHPRASSPSPAFSILMIFAPRSPRIWPAYGAATLWPSSTTTRFFNGKPDARVRMRLVIIAAILLIRSGHSEYMLADIREYHVGGYWRGPEQPRLTPFALDVVFARKAKSAKSLHARLGGVPRCLGGEELR